MYDAVNQINKKICKSGLFHTRAFLEVLSYLVRTMSLFPEDKKWELFDLREENTKLKAELEKIKKNLQNPD
ncbi:MAG: hypothetical protein WCL21_14575 [Mariniphaga sp.]